MKLLQHWYVYLARGIFALVLGILLVAGRGQWNTLQYIGMFWLSICLASLSFGLGQCLEADGGAGGGVTVRCLNNGLCIHCLRQRRVRKATVAMAIASQASCLFLVGAGWSTHLCHLL